MSKSIDTPKRKKKIKDEKTAYTMLSPAFILLTTFAIIPLIMAVWRSFHDYNTGEFVGFANYDYVLKTPTFTKSFGNIVLFTSIIVVCTMVCSFLLASLLTSINSKIANIIKIAIYIPCLISGVVVSIIYLFIINYGGGLLTSIFVSLGLDPIAFQTEGYWPIVCVLLPTFWLGFGYQTLVMYAGLMNISHSYYEAAQIDGANWFQRTWYITLPCLKNTIILMLVNLITANLQMMEIPLLITAGGPLDMTMTPSLWLFNTFRDPTRPQNVTIAGAILIMIVIVAINLIAFKSIHSNKSEDV